MVARPLILKVYLVWFLSLNTTAHIIFVFVRFSAGLFRFKFHCFSLTNLDFIQYGTCNVKTWSRSLLKIRLGYFMLLISLYAIVSRGFLTPHLMKSPYIYIYTPPTPHSFCCLVSLTGRMIGPNLMGFFLLNNMDLHMPWYVSTRRIFDVFYATTPQFTQYNAWDGFLLVTWFDNIHTHTHKRKRKQLTQGLVDWHTHKSIY